MSNLLPELLLLADAGSPGYEGLFTDFNTTLWSALLRMSLAMVAAAPFLVAGVFVAGILRGMVGAERTRRILGVGHRSGPLRAWCLGILLPICSLGALPVARELRRAGVPSGTVISFVLVAPVLNPVSIIYGLSHIPLKMLLYFALGTFLVSVGIGLLWNRLIAEKFDLQDQQYEKAPQASRHRLAVAGHTAATTLVGPAAIDYGLALLAVGILGALLPHGALQTGLTRDNVLAPVIMGVVAIPVYVTPTEVMMHFGLIVRDGFSLGAAFALIVLGAGANVGVANWLRRDYGLKSLALFVGLLIGATLLIGFTADRTVMHGTAKVTDHTHAFDAFTRLPIVPTENANVTWIYRKIVQSMSPDRFWGLVLLCLVAIIGIGFRLAGGRISVDQFLQRGIPDEKMQTTSNEDNALSPIQLSIAGVCGVLVAATIGLYIFYPPMDTLIKDMNNIRVSTYDDIRAKNSDETIRRIAQWRSRLQKLPTSVVIRFGSVNAQRRERVNESLYSLKTLEEYIRTGRFREAETLIPYIEKQYIACRNAFRRQQMQTLPESTTDP
ncbi:MAG: permease [Planctomycetota bacterium]|nr:permease [Planctomycetota bacterium]